MSVIERDFGHEKRHKARRLRQLLDLDGLHELNIRDNPVPYLERASERIFQLKKALFEARLAVAGPKTPDEGLEAAEAQVTIGKAEYERLLQCSAIVEKAYVQLVRDAPDE
jgi:hypothetical protein